MDGRARVYFKVQMDCGDPTLNTFQQFCTEAKRLGRSFEDRDFLFDENPETAGLMAMFQSYGGKG